jgi:hypothetical protein
LIAGPAGLFPHFRFEAAINFMAAFSLRSSPRPHDRSERDAVAIKLGNVPQVYRFCLGNASFGTCHMYRKFGKCQR